MCTKYVLLWVAYLFPLVSFSQPVISDITPDVGDQFLYVQYEQIPDPGPAGPDMTWDFTDPGTPLNQLSTEVVLPEDAPEPETYSESTSVWHADFGFGGFYMYFNFENGLWSEHGSFSVVFGGAQTVYTDTYDRIGFPFTYLDSGTDTYTKTITASGITTAYTGDTSYEVDAYGTLILSSGTYNDVVRVSVEITEEFSFSGSPAVTNTTENYWYSSEYPVALCIISISTSEFLGVPEEPDSSFVQLMLYNNAPLIAGENEIRLDFELYPNPTKDFIQLKYDHLKNGELRIYDASGNLIRSEPIRSESKIDIRDLSPGVYVASVAVDGSTYSNAPFVVTR